jgi:transcriptional regulator with XRE-family HTH domain
MRLDEYLNQQGLSLRAFARLAGVSVATVLRARDGSVISSRRTLTAIVEATGGAVGVSDLIQIDQAQHQQGKGGDHD